MEVRSISYDEETQDGFMWEGGTDRPHTILLDCPPATPHPEKRQTRDATPFKEGTEQLPRLRGIGRGRRKPVVVTVPLKSLNPELSLTVFRI